MPFEVNDLQNIRNAVRTYLNTRVTVLISALTPEAGITIQPDEKFSFSITVTNATAATGGIALKNVRYRLWMQNYAVGKLIVPPHPMRAYSKWLETSIERTPGDEISDDMYLFPPNEKNYLRPGETDTISGLEGRAGDAPAGGTTDIRFKIRAEVDMDYLFPKHEDSPTIDRVLTVIG